MFMNPSGPRSCCTADVCCQGKQLNKYTLDKAIVAWLHEWPQCKQYWQFCCAEHLIDNPGQSAVDDVRRNVLLIDERKYSTFLCTVAFLYSSSGSSILLSTTTMPLLCIGMIVNNCKRVCWSYRAVSSCASCDYSVRCENLFIVCV